MREIKYRAWMIEEFSVSNSSYDIFTLRELMSGKFKFNMFENWEQFTGLQDKNGLDIYDGDILEGKEKGDLGVVVYMSPSFVIVDRKGKVLNIGNGKVGIRNLDFTKIIGNIHQNKELLKQRKIS